MSFTVPYYKLYVLAELSSNDVTLISVDRQKLDLSIYIYLWYRKFYICRYTARFYQHKNTPRIFKEYLVISSIPNYFNNSKTLIICYKYNKPFRSTIFNFNKIVTDINIDSNTPDS